MTDLSPGERDGGGWGATGAPLVLDEGLPTALALPDASRLVVTTATSVSCWSLPDGGRRWRVRAPIASLAAAGPWVVVSLTDDDVLVLDAATGALHRRLGPVAHPPWRVALSADGRVLALGHRVRVELHDPASADAPPRRVAVREPPAHLALSADGQRLAYALGRERVARLDDLATGAEVARNAHKRDVDGVAVSPDGQQLVSADDEALLVSNALRASKGHGLLRSLTFSPDGALLLAAGGLSSVGRLAVSWCVDDTPWNDRPSRASLRAWRMPAGAALPPTDLPARLFAFSPDGGALAFADLDGRVHLGSLGPPAPAPRAARTKAGRAAAASPAAPAPAPAAAAPAPAARKAARGASLVFAERASLPLLSVGALAAAVSGDGAHVAAVVGETRAAARARRWVRATGELVSDAPVPAGFSRAVLSPDLTRAATFHEDDRVGLVDLATGAAVASLPGPCGYVLAVAFSPDGRSLAIGSGGTYYDHVPTSPHPGSLLVVDLGSGELRFAPLDLGEVRAVAWSPDGGTLAVQAARKLVVLDARTGERRRVVADVCQPLAFSPDGGLLAAGIFGKPRVALYETAGFAQVGTPIRLAMHHGASDSHARLAFRGDGQVLACCGDDEVVIWGLREDNVLDATRPNLFASRGVQFAPDGSLLEWGGGGVRVWPA